MESPNSLGNLLAYGAIIAFLFLVAVFVLRTLMLPLGVIFLSAARSRQAGNATPDVNSSKQESTSSVPTAPE